ncbi:hypothetical protein Lal_00043250 [Lupinus albus]|nr:hypothetical protein Lal_00043250 [Lupinus albus]
MPYVIMKDGRFKKNSHKFVCSNMRGSDSYPQYKRRCGKPMTLNRIFHYSLWLLLKYDSHLNVEVYSSIKNIKYLYKYVYKETDRVEMEVQREINAGEL